MDENQRNATPGKSTEDQTEEKKQSDATGEAAK